MYSKVVCSINPFFLSVDIQQHPVSVLRRNWYCTGVVNTKDVLVYLVSTKRNFAPRSASARYARSQENKNKNNVNEAD